MEKAQNPSGYSWGVRMFAISKKSIQTVVPHHLVPFLRIGARKEVHYKLKGADKIHTNLSRRQGQEAGSHLRGRAVLGRGDMEPHLVKTVLIQKMGVTNTGSKSLAFNKWWVGWIKYKVVQLWPYLNNKNRRLALPKALLSNPSLLSDPILCGRPTKPFSRATAAKIIQEIGAALIGATAESIDLITLKLFRGK